MYKYNKKELKEELTLEQIYDLLTELGAEPILKDNCIICKTICHNSDLANASHKLYYYSNTNLFHCYTGCGDTSFDIYGLILKVNKTNGIKNFSLSNAIAFVAKYFGYTSETFEFENNQDSIEDWKIINDFKRNKEKNSSQIIELKTYDDKILNYLPHPFIYPWYKEGITFEVMNSKGICYDPIYEGVVIPHYDIKGNLIGIRERTLIKENEIYGKYRPAIINGKMYNHPLSFNLYNLNFSKDNIKITQKAIIYEGKRQSRPSPLFHVTAWGYILINIANGQLNRKIKVVRESKS